MVRHLVPRLPALPVCLAVVQLLSPCSAQFAVVGPPEPIVAIEGEDAELPCHLSPEMSAETMELIWERASPRQVVHTYAHGQEDTPAAEYRGRTWISREDITVGKAALWIRDIRASDRGTYRCYFQDGDLSEKAKVELKVAGPFFRSAQPWVVAFAVTLLVLLVTLAGAGSFLWRQQRKTEVLRQEKMREQRNTERLQDELSKSRSPAPRILGTLVTHVTDSSCCTLQGGEDSSTDHVSAPDPHLSLSALIFQPLPSPLTAQGKDEDAGGVTRQGFVSVGKGLRVFLHQGTLDAGEQSLAYAEWKTALFQPADVFLDPDTAYPDLHVSEDKRSLQPSFTRQNLSENPERFCGNHCVLGCETFISGRHFWEVEVGGRAQWYVGVCRENVERKHRVNINPENGFWVMGRYPGSDYRALTYPRTTLTNVSPPERVGVFLDWELGEVSFYNALDGSHIFTFPHTRFSGPLRPVFDTWTLDPTPLTICPAQKAMGGSLVPDPGPDPSLETPVSPGSAGGNGDPQAEETSLLLAAPPGAEGLLDSKPLSRKGLRT
ncbi:butyrophilin subfamily 3 member A3-like [Phyllostomus discolor]|uniref:Butyrophilin subfamily 3 member A3-like n=1 Tax=Phyllostomus discolor TaxID=89673 RepID=A0A7E6CY48_9CHIR|nr:butyrophilin subfamily 3 member A3-like [Phyllostomus discolor]